MQKSKSLRSSYGELHVAESYFESTIVKKRQKDISDIDHKIINMFYRGSNKQPRQLFKEKPIPYKGDYFTKR